MSSNTSSDPRSDFIYLAQPTAKQWLLSAVMIVAWLFLSRPSLLPFFFEQYFGGIEGDAGIYVWLSRYTAAALFEHPWFETSAFFPYSGTLAFSDNFLLFGGVFAALRLVTPTDAAAYNATYLLLLAGGGLCAFRLMYALTEHIVTSTAAGLLSVTLAPFAAHLGHPQVQAFFIFPLLTLFVLQYFHSRQWQTALLMGISLVATFLVGVYFAIFGMLLVLFLCVALCLLHPRALSGREWGALAVAFCCGLLPALPFAIPYLHVRELFGARELYEAAAFSASPLSFFAFTPFSFLYEHTAPLSHSEAHLGFGFVLVALTIISVWHIFAGERLKPFRIALISLPVVSVAIESLFQKTELYYFAETVCAWLLLAVLIGGLVELRRAQKLFDCSIVTNRDIKASLLFAGALFTLLSLGPIAPLNDAQSSWAPYRVFFSLMPGVEAARASGRFGLVAIFFFSFLSLLTLGELLRKRKVSAPLFSGVLLLIFVENWCSKFPFDRALDQPHVFKRVRELAIDHGGHSAMIVLPYAPSVKENGDIDSWGQFARANVYAMNWALETGVPVVNGFSGQKTKFMRDLPRRLRNFPDEGSLRELASIYSLRYVVVVPKLFESFSRSEFEKTIERHDSLALRSKDTAGNYLFELVGAQPLDPEFVLKVPGTASTLELRIRIAPGCKDESVEVGLRESDALTPFARYIIDNDGEWKKKRVNVASLARTLGVRRISFETQSACAVLMQP